MNFILILRELWHRKILVVLATVGAAAIAALLVYNVSVSPPSLEKRDHSEAKGSIEILIDSTRSPIADVARNLEPLTARAGVFARFMAGGDVIEKVSRSTGIPVKQIEVAGPVPLPGEPIGETAQPQNLKPYGIAIVQRAELPIVNVETRAPTLSEARALAAAFPGAVSGIVSDIQLAQQTPENKRVTLRTLGPAQANLATEALGAKVAIAIFVALEVIALLLILGIPRLVRAWRSADVDPPRGSRSGSLPGVRPALPERSGGVTERSEGARASLALAEAIAERAQLKMRRSGDG